jgi:hypothetical protein
VRLGGQHIYGWACSPRRWCNSDSEVCHAFFLITVFRLTAFTASISGRRNMAIPSLNPIPHSRRCIYRRSRTSFGRFSVSNRYIMSAGHLYHRLTAADVREKRAISSISMAVMGTSNTQDSGGLYNHIPASYDLILPF